MFRLVSNIIILFFIPLNLYVGYRLWQTLRHYFPSVGKIAYWLIFWLLSLSFFAGRILGRSLPPVLDSILSTMGYYWLVGLFYLALIFIALDFIRYLGYYTRLAPGYRRFSPLTGLLSLILVVLIILYGSWNARHPQVTRYDLVIPKKAGDFQQLHVVMVSDIHLGELIDNNALQVMVNRINGLQPDLVVMPGDIVQDGSLLRDENTQEIFRGLKPRLGTYASLGNHENYGGRVQEIADNLKQANIDVLRDGYIKIADSFYLAGRDDPAIGRNTGRGPKPLSEITSGIDKNLPLILLNHQPVDLETARIQGVDLQLSGHTHRGQVFPGNLVTSRLFELDWGYLRKETLQLIVSSGYGTWGPSLRIGNNPEIVDIYITFE